MCQQNLTKDVHVRLYVMGLRVDVLGQSAVMGWRCHNATAPMKIYFPQMSVYRVSNLCV